ncbi:Friend virus susceptibility protein 1-like [Dasypus novemcinctus]|uniref:Friend virus susceptibility protein 1-like n=1 Tax=Dasypus novemcinctus TaxID=9361 RepID=UPI00265EFF53|nr:Friend virus susceptibility protein 1-like [Dasypus novemcinctus]XP_058136681.1 Friend virus susceptibility protein 1-like [Dasypus novemcinctus]XP_058136682.1 Friend virus susceptibility protein 1-like [Dasypus novemcinctus]XP_058136684.1 Friend virus susceptibility protein 1-like [Dasypus novemcinctus]
MAECLLAPAPVAQGDHCYTYTELLAVSRRFRQNPNELMSTWLLRAYDQGSSALALSSGSLALLGDLSHDAVFNYHCKALRGGRQSLLAWLLAAWHRRWPTCLHFEATELPLRPWATAEEGVQLARELGLLDWIYREPPASGCPEPAPEDVPFSQALRRHLLMAAPAELRPSLVSLLVKGLTVLEVVTEIQAAADVGLLWRQGQPGHAKLLLGPTPTRKDLLTWLLSHGVPREWLAKQPTRVLLQLYVQEARRGRGPPEQPPPYLEQASGDREGGGPPGS